MLRSLFFLQRANFHLTQRKFHHICLVREIRVKMERKKKQKEKRWPRMRKIGIENNKKIEQSWYYFSKLTHRHSM